MSRLRFEANDKKLSEVLFSNRKYQIPRFQRAYAWTTDEATQFWEDLSTSEEPYFIGSVIINNENESKTGFADVIDGQQRLLTTTILVAALRDHAKEIDPEKAKLYQRQDIAIEDRSGLEAYRITPDDSIAEYFQTYIQKGDKDTLESNPSSVAERKVRDNYKFFHESLAEPLKKLLTKERKIGYLDELRSRLAKLIVINVEISREEDAYEIFETTNARGLELSVADLMKNLIFRNLKSDGGSDYAKDVWQQINTDIEETGTDLRKFIRYYWISRYNFLSEKKLYREIKRRISDWQSLLEELKENSIWYNRLHEGNEEDFQDIKNGSKIYKSIFALRLMGVTQCHVFLMAVLRNLDRLGTDPTKVIQFIERFSFQYSAVCKLPANKIEKTYSKYAVKIERVFDESVGKKLSGEIQTIFHQLKSELCELAPSEALFIESFEDVGYKNKENARKLMKYILSELDNWLKHTDEHLINFGNVNLEHLLPQTPHKEWNLKRKDIKGYVNKLGNLTLLSRKINSSIQNSTIDKKLLELEKSQLAVTKDVVKKIKSHNCVWGETQIVERQREIASIAFDDIWNLKE